MRARHASRIQSREFGFNIRVVLLKADRRAGLPDEWAKIAPR
jgi:hypothetical protein